MQMYPYYRQLVYFFGVITGRIIAATKCDVNIFYSVITSKKLRKLTSESVLHEFRNQFVLWLFSLFFNSNLQTCLKKLNTISLRLQQKCPFCQIFSFVSQDLQILVVIRNYSSSRNRLQTLLTVTLLVSGSIHNYLTFKEATVAIYHPEQ